MKRSVPDRLSIHYKSSDLFDSGHYIHKYYLSPTDKRKLYPADISFLEKNLPEEFYDGTIFYSDLNLEKKLDGDLVRCGLLAISQYMQDRRAKLTQEEARAALNLNQWLSGYEKSLLAKKLFLEKKLLSALRGNDPFIVDFELELKIDFYLRENDPFYDNDDANEYDWDLDTSLMCSLNNCPADTHEIDNPEYWGLGDGRDHKDMYGREHSSPVRDVQVCSLFHYLTEHCGVPYKHLIRIGKIWADFEILYQNSMNIDLTGERIIAEQQRFRREERR